MKDCRAKSTFYGHKHTEESKQKMREAHLAGKNPNWVGDSISKSGVHTWIRRNFKKPEACQFCGKATRLDLANVSPKYDQKTYTRDLANWRWLCRKCHMNEDGRMKSFSNYVTENLRVPVRQFDKLGKFIKEFKSISDAATQTGILRTNIQNVISGLTHTAGGYAWKMREITPHSACQCHELQETQGSQCCERCGGGE